MVVTLRGTISATDATAEIGRTLKAIVQRGYRRILLSLEAATGSDTAAVGAFLEAVLDARARGADLKVVNVTPRVTNLGVAAAFYFRVFDCEGDALDSFLVENTTSTRRAPTRSGLQ